MILKYYISQYLIFIQENAFENVVWKMAAILSRPQLIKKPYPYLTSEGNIWVDCCQYFVG